MTNRLRSTDHKNSSPPGYLPLREAARWAGISTKTMKRWIERGLPRYQAAPREKVLIRPADIEQFLIRKKVPTVDINALVDQVLADLQRSPK